MNTDSNFFSRAATWAVIATCFVIPFATSLISLFSILVFIFWLLSGKFHNFLKILQNNPVALFSFSLFCLFCLGLSYTPAELDYSLAYLKKYRELLFIPIVISILMDNPIARKNCEYGFIMGCILLLLISYAMFFSIIPTARYGYSIVYHITHSFFMSLLAFWAAHKSIDSEQYRYLWITILIATILNLFCISTGRTGMFIFPFLTILFFIQRFSLLQQMLGLFLITLLLSITFFSSENFSSRFSTALQEVQNYEYGASRTSLGQRFDWWIGSIELIKDKPLLGHGTGSFTTVHNALIAKTKIKPTDNPHNEYLLIGVQLGLTGLIGYFLLFVAQIKCSLKLQKNDRMFAQGVVVAMLIGCLMNSFLFDSHQGHFFAFLSAVYFSSSQECKLSLS